MGPRLHFLSSILPGIGVVTEGGYRTVHVIYIGEITEERLHTQTNKITILRFQFSRRRVWRWAFWDIMTCSLLEATDASELCTASINRAMAPNKGKN
jgi:hypothetical protein